MKHLSETELLDAVDGCLSPDRLRHVDACGACSSQVNDLREVLTRASDADVPEPSPLFWDHLSQRVRQGIEHDTPGRWTGWKSVLRPWPVAAAVTTAVTLILAVNFIRPSSPKPVAHQGQVAEAIPRDVPPDVPDTDPDPDDVDGDEAWAVVRAVADDVVWADVNDAGISARPGSADRAVLTLTAAERSALATLLAEELKRAGA